MTYLPIWPDGGIKMTRYVVVGSGAAGISAVEAIRSQDKTGEIYLLAAEKQGYYSRPGLAYYLTGELSSRFLYPFSKADFERLGVKRIPALAKQLNVPERTVQLATGEMLQYDRLLLAVGAQAVRPGLPGHDLRGVVYLDSFAETKLMIKVARRARRAVVVGGGITALEIVEGLRARNLKVDFFLRRDRYWGNVLDPVESRIVESRLADEGVRIHYHTEAAEILNKRGRVAGVRTKTGEQIACQMVAFAIGTRPRLRLAQTAGLNTERGVLVDEYLQTSQPDIYAAGDVAQVYDPSTGQSSVDSLWSIARQQGYVAGLNMAGQRQAYQKTMPFNVTRLVGLTTTIIGMVGGAATKPEYGIVRGESETWRLQPNAIALQSHSDVNRVRVLVGEQHLMGALVMGNQALSPPLQDLIAAQVDIRPIRVQLLSAEVDLPELIMNFWQTWRQNVASQ